MQIDIPSPKPFFVRQSWKLRNWFAEKRKENIFCLEIMRNGEINDWWGKNDGFGMVTQKNRKKEISNIYIWNRTKTLFFVEGISQAVNFTQFAASIDTAGKDLTLFDDVKLKEKCDNESVANMIKASKNADILLVCVIVAAGAGVLSVAILMDLIHSPILENIKNNLETFKQAAITMGWIK